MAQTTAMQGNAFGESKTETKTLTVEERYKFATPKDVEHYSRLVDKDQTYIRIDDKGKPIEADKDYFWRIVSMHPTIPEGLIGSSKFYISLGLQKFDRTKFKDIAGNGNRKTRTYQAMPAFRTDEDGQVLDADSWAAPHIRADEFAKLFKAEE